VVILLVAGYFSPKIYAYYQAERLEKEGDNLIAKDDYQQALQKYLASKVKREDKTINYKISQSSDLIDSENSYKNGVDLISKEKWDEAIISLSKVKKNHKDYERAMTLISSTEKIIQENNLKKTQIQVKKTNPTVLTVTKIPTQIPTIFIQPTTFLTPVPAKIPILLVTGVTVNCDKDYADEVRTANANYDKSLKDYANCGFACINDKGDCRFKCASKYMNSPDLAKACENDCLSVDCTSLCAWKSSQSSSLAQILNTLVSSHCN